MGKVPLEAVAGEVAVVLLDDHEEEDVEEDEDRGGVEDHDRADHGVTGAWREEDKKYSNESIMKDLLLSESRVSKYLLINREGVIRALFFCNCANP